MIHKSKIVRIFAIYFKIFRKRIGVSELFICSVNNMIQIIRTVTFKRWLPHFHLVFTFKMNSLLFKFSSLRFLMVLEI